MLYKIPGRTPQRIHSFEVDLRFQFRVNDRVSFEFKGQVVDGIITRLNPKRAHILCDDDKEYQVPYALLKLVSRSHQGDAGSRNRNDEELCVIAQRIRGLMAQHHLSHWHFRFDNGTKRAGCCHFESQVISLSHEFARSAPELNIEDTILHEIAHALVGKKHNHDAVWRAKAIEIGCSGKRCHNMQFTPPRYIVKCENNCWVATSERRRRGMICSTCDGDLVYLTYTEERWKREKSQVPGKTGQSSE